MQLKLPDCPPTRELLPEALRLELVCALYARGRVGKTGGAELAGVDLVSFQRGPMKGGRYKGQVM